jgi:hypothetical protein
VSYTHALKLSHVRLWAREDELIWDFHPSGRYTQRDSYVHLNIESHNRDVVLWWK